MSDKVESISLRPDAAVPRRRRWLSVLLAVSLLFSGAVIGAGLATLVIVKRVQYGLTHPETFPTAVAGRLRRVLDLTPEQVRSVESILRRRQGTLQELRREIRPRLEAELDQIQQEIAAELTPEQAARWEKWLNEKRSRWLPAVPHPERTGTASAPF